MATTTKTDYYELLGVPRKATAKDIRAAFRKLARKYHPDLNPGDKASEEKFKQLQEAYDILSDSKKRQMYDQYGFYSENVPTGDYGPGTGGGQANVNFDFSGFDFGGGSGAAGGGSSFRDLFSQFFGGRGGVAVEEEAEKMRVEAESHAEDDRRRMEEVEARNRLDGIVYQAEKTIRENREKLPADDVKAAEEALEEAKKAMSDGGEGNTARLRAASEKVEATLHKMAETLYKTSQTQQAEAASAGAGTPGGGQPGGGAQGGAGKPGDVIDAEYVDVDEKKRPN